MALPTVVVVLIARAFLSVVMASLSLARNVMPAQPMELTIAVAPNIASFVATVEMALLMMQLEKHVTMVGNSTGHQAILVQPTAPPSVLHMNAVTVLSSLENNATTEPTMAIKETVAAPIAHG